MRRLPTNFIWLAMLAVTAATGCARYQYELVAPTELAQPIPDKVFVRTEPLEFDFANLGERLYVRLGNPTDDVVELDGGRSYVVGPRGETHPMAGALIAPHSFIDFALPPSVAVVHAYPRYGFGYGYYGRYRGLAYYPYPWGAPPYAYDYYVGRAPVWDWTTGEVRLHLSFVQSPDRGDFDAAGPPEMRRA